MKPCEIVVCRNHASIVGHLADQGADVDICRNDGHTPLHVAAQVGHVQTIRTLLEKGVDINKTVSVGVCVCAQDPGFVKREGQNSNAAPGLKKSVSREGGGDTFFSRHLHYRVGVPSACQTDLRGGKKIGPPPKKRGGGGQGRFGPLPLNPPQMCVCVCVCVCRGGGVP